MITLKAGTDEISLELASGDSMNLQGKGSYGQSRSGTINELIHGHIKYTFVLTFNHIIGTDVSGIRTFLINTVGKDVEYTDVHGTKWDVAILNPDAPIVQHGRNRFSLSLELEGVPQ